MTNSQKLLDIQHQTLKVLALRVVDVNRMVGGLGELVEDAHLATSDGCSREDRRAEELLRYRLRAGEGEENTATLNLR